MYNEGEEDGGEANLYVHHDILLPSFPLAVTWMDCGGPASAGGAAGNFAAVGTARARSLGGLRGVFVCVCVLGGDSSYAALAPLPSLPSN